MRVEDKIKIIELEELRLTKLLIDQQTKLFKARDPLKQISLEVSIACLENQIEAYQTWKAQLQQNTQKT